MWILPRHITVVLAAGIALFLLSACLVWAALGFPALTGPHALAADKRFDLIKISLSVVAGVGGVLALVVTYHKQRLSEAAERREDNRLLNERFVTASSQLGHELPMVRLAGIHALAGLADDWPEQRQVCINVLCAYLPGALHRWLGSFDDAHFSGSRVTFGGTDFADGRVSFARTTFSKGPGPSAAHQLARADLGSRPRPVEHGRHLTERHLPSSPPLATPLTLTTIPISVILDETHTHTPARRGVRHLHHRTRAHRSR